MNSIILHNHSARIIRILAIISTIITLLFCGFKIVTAIQYEAITVDGTSGNITVNGNTISGLKITPAVVFNNTSDSITYRMTLTNPDGRSFKINNISDDNTNQYITTSYSYSREMNNEEKPILITLSYDAYIPLGDDLSLQDIHITIDIDEEESSTEKEGATEEESPTKEEDNNSAVVVPNTGGNASKYLKTSPQLVEQKLAPYIIACILSVAIIITMIPKKSRVKFGKVVFTIIVIAASKSVLSAYAEPAKLELTIYGANISAKPDTAHPQEVISVTFPNIYNNKVQDRDGESAGNAIILKTLDDKYVLMDTGPSTADVRSVIYNTLASLQGKSQVTIDYLILSHLDLDHCGNAVSFINDSNFSFKNIVLKHEINRESVSQRIAQAAANNNVNIITSNDAATQEYLSSIGVTNYDKIFEGMTIDVGKYLKLDFFNTPDVYVGKECKTGLSIFWTASTSSSNNYIKTSDGQYIYIDGSEYGTKLDGEYPLSSSKYPYADVTFKTTPTLIEKPNGAGMNRYFYAISEDNRGICRSNPNAFGVLAEVTTAELKRYMYFPGDIENAGYGSLSSGVNSSAIYEDIAFQNGDFVNNITPYAIPSEDNTATAIYNKLAADATSLGLPVSTLLNNISIYQESHHGSNNSEKAVWKLGINRASGIYAIQEGATNMATTTSYLKTKTYWYTLGKIPAENKMRVGDSGIDGVHCTINTIGTTLCSNY